MKLDLPLDQMSTEDKLQAMEVLWESLSRDAGEIASPAWHGEVLAERLGALERGEVEFEDLNEVKRKIRRQIS
ncbi:addiction module protein [Halochromatium glycolicum]|jgi:hypothetical protein|uniref:Addiction module antitoxin RelB n=1 Tax=Halochromatium glycolicum TaxID=85075 RepID=A0AAJ0XAA1_9GAMM|nr:addiction module protein [Halochromatium glycolicum]MBK1704930.1 hypothetical protein [Halochromatium glycolicum]